MRYGLSLLVCFVLTVSANAQVCNGPTCAVPQTVVKAVATARVASGSCCGVSQVSSVKTVGPIRQFFRNVFRR